MSDSPTFQFEETGGGLVVRVHGRDILEKKEPTFQALAADLKSRSPKATLVDVRAVPGPITFMDRFQFGEMAAKHLGQFTVAALMQEEQIDPQRIGQQVARNRGIYIEVFLDPAQAEAWLKKHAAPG